MNIEKALRTYLKGNGPKVKEKDYFEYTEGQGNAILNVLFKLANEELDTMTDAKTLDRLVEVLKLGEITLHNENGINRKIVARKLNKLHEKLDRIIAEGHRKFANLNKIKSEFNKVRRELDVLLELNEAKDTKQYDFMTYLIHEARNFAYLEYTLKKMPALANVRDKDEVPLIRNLIGSYIKSLQEAEEEDTLYYENLITLILSQRSFILSETEKRNCLDDIYKYINKISYNKKAEKRNKAKIDAISQLVDRIKGLEDSSKDIGDIASKYDIHVFFQPALLEDLHLIKEAKEGTMTDRRVVEDFIVSIDGEDAIEIDDALSCKKLENGNYLLGVHIASVLGYFPYESQIVQEAIHRNQSIYLPSTYQSKDNDFNRTVPIFPYDFSADEGSLKEGEKRLTRSYFFEITPTGEVVNEEFVKSIIKNDRRLTYKQVDQILQNGCTDPKVQETIQNLMEVTTLLDSRYVGTELYQKVKEATDDYTELRVKKAGAENIVYQSMLLTGNRVAEFFSRNNYPFLYRVHEVNEENNRKLQAMIDSLNETYGGEQFKNLYQLIEGIYPRGWYAMEGRHSGLDIDHYCHCTSVLRRAADIVVEHALEVCHDKTPTEEELEELREEIAIKAAEINYRQTPIDYFVKEYKKKYRRR